MHGADEWNGWRAVGPAAPTIDPGGAKPCGA